MNGEVWCVGVDVGGRKKGLHAAARTIDDPRIQVVFAALDAASLVREIRGRLGAPAVVAIDAPPRPWRAGPDTRSAERALHRAGYRIQWTRQAGEPPQEWMVVGAEVWTAMAAAFPEARLVETFPTAASDRLAGADTLVPLAAIAGQERRPTVKDYLDAVVASDVAVRVLSGQADWFGDPDDPDGRIAV